MSKTTNKLPTNAWITATSRLRDCNFWEENLQLCVQKSYIFPTKYLDKYAYNKPTRGQSNLAKAALNDPAQWSRQWSAVIRCIRDKTDWWMDAAHIGNNILHIMHSLQPKSKQCIVIMEQMKHDALALVYEVHRQLDYRTTRDLLLILLDMLN